MSQLRIALALIAMFIAGAAAATTLGAARAEPLPAFDRPLVERLVRAQEEQVRVTQQEVRTLEALARTAERCKQ